MKYMHLNSSCPYAGLANLLQLQGHDTEDTQIALDIDLASHIRWDRGSGAFRSGFSLQSKEWFDLYLNPRGFTYEEQFWPGAEVPSRLSPGTMLGIFLAPGQKHAVICSGRSEDRIVFLNNKREGSEEPDVFHFTPAELLERLSEQVTVGRLTPSTPTAPELGPIYRESLETWALLRRELHDFMCVPQTAEDLRAHLDPLFRPLLLDGLTMAQLRRDTELADNLTLLQTALLHTLRQGAPARLSDHLDMALLDASMDQIVRHTAKKSAQYV